MYKKQLGFQKIACTLAVVTAAVWFVYSLGMITDIYDALYFTMMDPNNLQNTLVPGSILYYDMQGFNGTFLYVSIGLILLSCLLYLTNTHIRRKYYIGNFVATGLYCAATVATVVWTHLQIEGFKYQFLSTVDFEALKTYSEAFSSIKYTTSTFLLDLHWGVAALALATTGMLVYNLIWKRKVMAEEEALLAGKGAAA